MMCNNPNLDLVNMNAYKFIKFGEILSFRSQDIERKQNFGVNQGHNSGANARKMKGNNTTLDLVNISAYAKFGEIILFCTQDIERKRNFERNSGINEGP